MDRLTEEQQQTIRKTSSSRLITRLINTGRSEEEVDAMDRGELLNAWAEIVAKSETEGRETPKREPSVSSEDDMPLDITLPPSFEGLPDIEAKRLELERWKIIQEMALKRRELEYTRAREAQERADREAREAQERADREAREAQERAERQEQLREERELERRRMELKEARELQLEEKRFAATLEMEKQKAEVASSRAGKMKLFGDAVRAAMSRQPEEAADNVAYFRRVTDIFDNMDIPKDFRTDLIMPYLNAKSRNVIARLDPAVARDFDQLKQVILLEYRLSPTQYSQLFNNAIKQHSETFTMFANRLKAFLLQYLESRKIGEDFEKLTDLLVCDRIKSTLKNGCLRYILGIENVSEDGWMRSNELTQAIDKYLASYSVDGKQTFEPLSGLKSHSNYVYKQRNGQARNEFDRSTRSRDTNSQLNLTSVSTTQTADSQSADCRAVGNNKTDSVVERHSTSKGTALFCRYCKRKSHDITSCLKLQAKKQQAVQNDIRTNRCSCKPTKGVSCEFLEPVTCPELGDRHTIVKPSTATDILIDVALSPSLKPPQPECALPLKYVDINIDELNAEYLPLKCLDDSGSQLAVINSRYIDDLNLPQLGTVNLRGIVGESFPVPLVQLHISLADAHLGMPGRNPPGSNCQLSSLPIICASCPNLNESFILPSSLIDQLISFRDATVNKISQIMVDESDGHNIDEVEVSCDSDDSNQNEDDLQNSRFPESHTLNLSNFKQRKSTPNSTTDTEEASTSEPEVEIPRDALIREQQNDQSLKPAFLMLAQGKGNFFLHNGLLYRKACILGQTYSQLCLPKSRRDYVLRLGHANFGCHFNWKRTKQRICLSFYWLTIARDTKEFCKFCKECQRKRPVTKRDRVPITAVNRPEVAFEHWAVDVAGPLLPETITSVPRYALVMIDQASKWPEVIAIRSLTAKTICQAMIQTWSRTGTPRTITVDNASYFSSELHTEFLRRLGCSPRFITPLHPEANAIAERGLATIKMAISKMAADNPKKWTDAIGPVLWAIREQVHSTTHVSPFFYVYGKIPRGPLAILHDFWTTNEGTSVRLGKSTEQYLAELQANLETARKYAEFYTEKEQASYVKYYNLRSKDKSFHENEPVLVLLPDSTTSKVFSRWREGVILKKLSDYSYLVEVDGARHHRHANHLRKYYVKVQHIDVNFSSCDPNLLQPVSIRPDELPLDNRVMNCPILSDLDRDFGEIEAYDINLSNRSSHGLPSDRIATEQIGHLTPNQRKELLDILDQFPDVFSDVPGKCDLVEHEIKLKPGFKPKQFRPYRVPEKLKPLVRENIQEMMRQGVIVPSKSPMVSPLVVIMKGKTLEDGLRLAVNYKYINSFTEVDPYPVPDIESIIQHVGKSHWISTFDCSSAYWATSVRKSDRPLTAFICEEGIFEFTKTPYGMINSGSTFIRAIQQVLQPLRRSTEAYVDDIICHTRTEWYQHLDDIKNFLLAMREAKLTLKLKKCQFARKEVKFCGKIIGSGTKRPDPQKLAAVKQLGPARTKSEVRGLLGFFNFFREHIPNFAELAKPLTDLTGKGVPNVVPWGEVHDQALQLLKQALCEATDNRLYIADFNVPFYLYTDASDHTVAGILTQILNEKEVPVAFFSQKLTQSQKSWATIEKEAFAVLSSLRKFRHWVWGTDVYVLCDHNPLTYLAEASGKSSKLTRWFLALQEYRLHFRYKPGKQNIAADYLSRA